MKEYLRSLLNDKKIMILGYGREGRSTLKLLGEIIPEANITVADMNSSAFINDPLISSMSPAILSGSDYLDNLEQFEVVIKSPGISLNREIHKFNTDTITSQTDLFISYYKDQVIGITGTKGKSTTTSLLYHILHMDSDDVLIGGNIGIPVFDLISRISPDTKIVCELSSHQLQFIRNSPKYSILLNIFQEHLDHYNSYHEYKLAKYNIALYQRAGDYFIYDAADEQVNELVNSIPTKGEKIPVNSNKTTTGIKIEGNDILIKTSNTNKRILPKNFKSQLIGDHNRSNAIIAAAVAALLNIPSSDIEEAINSFMPLEHRLEYVGSYKSASYYNDSISTIPESTIAAIESLKHVDTLILGGFNRGIDYSALVDYFMKGTVKQIVTTGPAGAHIYELIRSNEQIIAFHIDKFDDAVKKAIQINNPGGICLLSPAASSYNEFKNFEERGKRFKEIIRQQSAETIL